jgi:uncharacterized protein
MNTSIPLHKSAVRFARPGLLQAVSIQAGILLLAALAILATRARLADAFTFGSISLAAQGVVGLGVGAFLAGGAALALFATRWGREEQLRLAAAWPQTGPFNVLVNGLLAGLGAEILFRAALQPLIGIWAGAALFALAEALSGNFGLFSGGRLANSLMALGLGLACGALFQAFGLGAALIAHAVFRVVFLALAGPVLSPGVP